MSLRIWLFLRSGLRLYYLFVVSLPSCLCWREVKSQRAEAVLIRSVRLELRRIGRWQNFQVQGPQGMGCEQVQRRSCLLARGRLADQKRLRRKATNTVLAGSWQPLCDLERTLCSSAATLRAALATALSMVEHSSSRSGFQSSERAVAPCTSLRQ